MSVNKERDAVKHMEAWLKQAGAQTDHDALKSLPTTRTLGQRFQVSHVTAARLLARLAHSGVIWQHPNGRYYPAFARKVIGRPKPFAVLLRRMDTWSGLCREVMEGFEAACAEAEHPLLLIHLKQLLVEPSPGRIHKVASPRRQAQFLKEIVLRYGDDVAGFFVDELWSDTALEAELPADKPIATFYRDGGTERVKTFTVDHQATAMLALGHLMACRYERIILLSPYRDYLPVRASLDAARAVYQQLSGQPWNASDIVSIATDEQMDDLIKSLTRKGAPRTGLLCPEDNNAIVLATRLIQAGVGLGRQHGLVSTMGTALVEHSGVTAIRHPYSEMGKTCARYLLDGTYGTPRCPPTLMTGSSTSLPG